MASIQQSLNQLLGAAAGAATAGSYMYRQSGTYQAQKAGQAAEKLGKISSEYTESLKGKMTQEQGQTIIDLENEVASMRKEALMAKPTKERAKEYQKALIGKDIAETDYSKEGLAIGDILDRRPHKTVKNEETGEWEIHFLDEETPETPATPKEEAETDAASRLGERIITAREMFSNLMNRKDILSAKERGQLATMYGKHKEKGGMDE